MGRKVTVTKLSSEVKKSDLRDLFEHCGKVLEVWKHDREAIIVWLSLFFWPLSNPILGWREKKIIRIINLRNSIRLGLSRKPWMITTSMLDIISYKLLGRHIRVDIASSRSRSRSSRYSRSRTRSRSRSRSRGRQRKPKRKPSSRDQCFICKEFGHW